MTNGKINHPNHITLAEAQGNMESYKTDTRIINKTWGSYLSTDGLYAYLGAVPGSGAARSTGYRKCPLCKGYIAY